jgi:hypothetical protein
MGDIVVLLSEQAERKQTEKAANVTAGFAQHLLVMRRYPKRGEFFDNWRVNLSQTGIKVP